MSTSLYQKYRPTTFADVIGQEHIRTTLRSELRSQAVSHAYLFSGPRGVGKTTVARVLARGVNCTALSDGDPCNSCDACVSILQGKAFDIIEIDAASNTGVDHVRDNIINNARVAPAHLAWKVFIIDEVHMLSTAAFNALLKTLEEPPTRTLFILATTELHKVPETIVSRCERFAFHRIAVSDMIDRLRTLVEAEGKAVEEDVLAAIAKRAQGAQRDAESMLGQLLVLDDNPITLDAASLILPRSHTASLCALWDAIVQKNTKEALSQFEHLSEHGVFMSDFSREWIEFLRVLLLAAVEENTQPFDSLDLQKAEMDALEQSLQQISPRDISAIISRFLEADGSIARSPIPSLPLEIACVDVITQNQQPTTESSKPAQKPQETFKEQPLQQPIEQPIEQPKKLSQSTTAQTVTPPPPSEVQTKEPPAQTDRADVTYEHVTQKWRELLAEMNHHNHALKLTFQVAQLVSVEKNVMTLGFQHQFYKDRIEDHRNREVIHRVLENIFGNGMTLIALVGEEYGNADEKVSGDNVEAPSNEDVANVWDLASAAFGTSGASSES